MGPHSTGKPLDPASATSSTDPGTITVADLAEIESPVLVDAIVRGDLEAFVDALHTKPEPIPVGVWRKLKRWAEGASNPVLPMFARAAMLDAALADDPLPDEPADLRATLADLNPSDPRHWAQVLFATGVYTSRCTAFLAARLIEHHLGTTWATSMQPFDATNWRIAMVDPLVAFDETGTALSASPCWITRTADSTQRAWQTPVVGGASDRSIAYSYTATRSAHSALMVSNTVVFGLTGVMILGNNRPHWFGIRTLGHDYNATALMDIVRVTLRKADSVFSVSSDRVVILCDPFFGNYYHCLLDYATRLAATEYLIHAHNFLIGIPTAQADVMVPILEALGFADSVVVLGEEPTVFQTIAIVAATQHEPYAHPDALLWLSDRVRARVTPGPPRRVLISRRDAGTRRVVNEAELVAALQSYGVELVVPSTLTPAEQLALFASAELIIAPHGAALANLVACAAGTKVIEIAAVLEPSICFTSISELLGLKHVLVQATAVEPDLHVEIDHVAAALAALGVAPMPLEQP